MIESPSTARDPRLVSSETSPRVGSASSSAPSTSLIVTVTAPPSEVHDGHAAGVDERLHQGVPLREHERALARLAEPDVTAVDVLRLRRLLDRDAEQLVQIAPRPDRQRDPGDQPFALERVRERPAEPLRSGRGGLRRERLHEGELRLVEQP